MAEGSTETADAAVETADAAVKATVDLENGQVAAKEDRCSEEWVALAAHNLGDG